MLNPDVFLPSEEFTLMVKKRNVSCDQESHETINELQDIMIMCD
jgi:hypothetical protein